LPPVQSPPAPANAETPPQIHVAHRAVSGKALAAGVAAAKCHQQTDEEMAEDETTVTMHGD
jgi:hypothetical protein